MYKIKEAIIVEGTYDKIKLSNFIDGIIITTGGFSVFKNKNLCKTIAQMAQNTGIVILTDSDTAGFKIRSYIKQNIPDEYVKHAYVPDIAGKEQRKKTAGKEGLLGVEGMSEEIIIDELKKAGCVINGSHEDKKSARAITKADLMNIGLAGCDGSSELRKKLLYELQLPSKMSSNMMLDIINRLLDYDELVAMVNEIRQNN